MAKEVKPIRAANLGPGGCKVNMPTPADRNYSPWQGTGKTVAK